MKCPKCDHPTVPAIAINNSPSEFWRQCPQPDCPTYINTYKPLPHQHAVHTDTHTYTGNFGGYGTGKTLTSRQEIYKHLLITPNANILIGANIRPQYEQTIKRDIEADLPRDFVKHINKQENYIDFQNNARIIFRPFDDPDKLRSLNLSFFLILEGSEVKADVFHQLKTRLRNQAAIQNNQDWRKGIIESNPDSGWIRLDVLYKSEQIQKHGDVLDDTVVPPDAKDPHISSHIASTSENPYLPNTFIEELTKNKPAWWVHRYLYGSFSYAEGLVYPSYPSSITTPFPIPQNWKRIIAADYGLHDNFVYLFGAIDPYKGILYIYKEAVTNNKSIEQLADLYHKQTEDIPQGALLTQPILDPKSMTKRDYTKKDLASHFLDYGIFFKPGHVSVDARVYRVNTYLESGKLKIFNTVPTLIEELSDYKFPPKTLDTTQKRNADKPIDKNNHCINPLEWICMDLPSDPSNLIYAAYDPHGQDTTDPNYNPNPYHNAQKHIPFQLRDDELQTFNFTKGVSTEAWNLL